MSKKAVPIWKLASGEKLAQKQKEYEEFFKSVPPRTELRLALKEEKSIHHTGFEMPTKADLFKHELFSLEVWAKRYQQTGNDFLAKLFQVIYVLKTHFVNSDLKDLPEVQTANLQQALKAYKQSDPESMEEIINEFDYLEYRQWNQVDSKYLSKLILGASQRRGFKKGKFKNARMLALPFADKMKSEFPRISSRKIYEAFVTHLKSQFSEEEVPEISTFRLWLNGKHSRIEELPEPEFHLLAEAIQFFSNTEPEKANGAIEELAYMIFMQFDEIDPALISRKLNRAKHLGKPKSIYKEVRPLAKPFADKVKAERPSISLKELCEEFELYLSDRGLDVVLEHVTFSRWISD